MEFSLSIFKSIILALSKPLCQPRCLSLRLLKTYKLPTIENKKTNLHLHQKTQINPHINTNIYNRQLQFKNLVNNINVKNLNDCIFYANKIYNICNEYHKLFIKSLIFISIMYNIIMHN